MDEPMHAADSGEARRLHTFRGRWPYFLSAAAVTSPQYNNIYVRGREIHIAAESNMVLQAAGAEKKCVGSARGRSACRWLNALAGLMELRLWRTGRPDKLTSTPSTPRCMWTAAAAKFHNAQLWKCLQNYSVILCFCRAHRSFLLRTIHFWKSINVNHLFSKVKKSTMCHGTS
jgi:hypothetical protein